MQTHGLCWTIRCHVVGGNGERETETQRQREEIRQKDAERDGQRETRALRALGAPRI